MSTNTPPPLSDPLEIPPISVLPPIITPVNLSSDLLGSSNRLAEPNTLSEAEIQGEEEGTIRMAEKVAEAEQKRAAAAKASKARKREGERGQWWPCDLKDSDLQNLEAEGFLQKGSWRFVKDEPSPAPLAGEKVMTKAWVERGLSLPPSDFFLEVLKAYGLQPHNITPNSYIVLSNFVTLFEGHLGIRPEVDLFRYYYAVKRETPAKGKGLANCGSITFKLRPKRQYPILPHHESARYWNSLWFYHKDIVAPNRAQGLPDFVDGAPQVLDSWTLVLELTQLP